MGEGIIRVERRYKKDVMNRYKMGLNTRKRVGVG